LAWIFLAEALGWGEVLGMVLAALGTLAVQIRPPVVRSSDIQIELQK